MKKLGVLVLLCMLFGISSCKALSANKDPKAAPRGSVFQKLKLEEEEIIGIDLVYKNQRVSFSDSLVQDFLETLTLSQECLVEEKHLFFPSDYGIIFVTETGEIPVVFYWFSGREMEGERITVTDGDPMQPFKYVDDRFDVQIDEIVYHFRFGCDKEGRQNIWTEDTSRQVYDAMASQQGLFRRGILDGFDYFGYGSPSYLEPNIHWQEVIDLSDIVALTTYLGKRADNTRPDSWPWKNGLDCFVIEDLIKGEIPGEDIEIQLIDWYGEDAYNGRGYAIYPVANPPYIQGETYLLVLQITESTLHEMDLYGSGGYSAVVDDGTVFPRYNTEHHPFYNISLADIRDYCNKTTD